MGETILCGSATPTLEGFNLLTSPIVSLKGTTANDTWKLFTLPKGCKVLAAEVVIVEAAGETCTIDVGITGGDVDFYVDGADVNQAAGTVIVGSGVAFFGADHAAANWVANHWTAATRVDALAVTGSTYAAGKFYVKLAVVQM